MNSKLKRTTTAVVAAVLLLAVIIPSTTLAVSASFYNTDTASNPNNYKTGDIIEFGNYPETLVSSEELISALTSLAGSTDSWTSYNYYSGSGNRCDGLMRSGSYMRFRDVYYDGCEYRGVFFDSYRPYYTSDSCSESNSRQGDNGYSIKTIYWFKYEPIRWRILDPSSGLLMADSILDSQAFNNYCKHGSGKKGIYYYGDSSLSHLVDEYPYSSINTWLDNSFYNTAFNNQQKECIRTTIIENRSSYPVNSIYYVPASNAKVFLLANDEVENTNYGFARYYPYADYAADYANNDVYRRLQGTDYAKCQGLHEGCWRLRSSSTVNDDPYGVNPYGNDCMNCYSYDTSIGIVPALRLSTLQPDVSHHMTYTVEFNANGGSNAPKRITKIENTWITLPSAVPTRSQHIFLGWSESPTATAPSYAANSRFSENANTTLYAVWKHISVNTVSINSIELDCKASAKLDTVIQADPGVKYTATYKSENGKIATVDGNGNVKANKRGSTTISCTVTDEFGHTVKDTCTVTVNYTWWQWIIIIVLFGWLWY